MRSATRSIVLVGLATALGCAGERRAESGSEANAEVQRPEEPARATTQGSSGTSQASPATQYPGESGGLPEWEPQSGSMSDIQQGGEMQQRGSSASVLPRATADSCAGIVQPASCPIEQGDVVRIENVPNGVVLHLRPADVTPQAELDRQIRCYEAHQVPAAAGPVFAGTRPESAGAGQQREPVASGGAAGAPESTCLLAMPGVTASVASSGSALSVTVTTTDQSTVVRLQQRARELTRRTAAADLRAR